MSSEANILVIDDDPAIGSLIALIAHGLGLSCLSTTNSKDFLEAVCSNTSLIFLDLMMPRVDGVQVMRALAQTTSKAGIVVMCDKRNRLLEATRVLAGTLGLGVTATLQKPIRVAAIETLLRHYIAPVHRTLLIPAESPTISDEELQTAVRENEFVLHYQPQITLASGELAGFEALVRWKHPERGLVFPDFFIPRLEKLRLLDRLGLIVARLGIAESANWQGVQGRFRSLSLNVSASSLLDLELPDTLLGLVHAGGVRPQDVIVEVTESALLSNLRVSLDVLIRLRIKGFQISIDDFGTGYAMMEQLRYIPATEIKIDKSFVQNMSMNGSDRVVVEKTVEIGHELGMKVVAEGVESETQFRFLESIGCDIAQGYLFSRPLPPGEIDSWIQNFEAKRQEAACQCT